MTIPADPAAFDTAAATREALRACADLAALTEVPGEITRPFLCASAVPVHAYLRGWADRLGLSTRLDAAGNLRSRLETARPAAPTLYLGSHLDTVPNAGAFDGILGVVLAYALVEGLIAGGHELPFHVEVLGFSEEEGVRFGASFLGSRALVGTAHGLLTLRDAQGISAEQAIRDFGLDPAGLPQAAAPAGGLGYFEIHIEQGPVLQDAGSSVGIVSAIVGQDRLNFGFTGQASHAGTTPMHLRRDALAAAARLMVAAEDLARSTPGLVATVGMVSARPGAGNVIPGEAGCSLDLRHADDAVRASALARLTDAARQAAAERGVTVEVTPKMQAAAVPMSPAWRAELQGAAADLGLSAPELVSGAGHDAQIMAQVMPAAMLFVRSPNALSHHPDEMVHEADVQDALRVGLRFLERLAQSLAGRQAPDRGEA